MFDLIIRGGTIYGARDSRPGAPPARTDVGVAGDRIAAVGDLSDAPAGAQIDATGKAVAPGFINVLSHSYFSMLHDPRSLSELTKGVTTQVFGEGSVMGPLNQQMRTDIQERNADLSLDVHWSRLSEYLAHLERSGCAQNIASFIGNGTLRPYVLGYQDRPATAVELDRMRGLVAEEMADGALGLASALIYPPESYASTEELIALSETVAAYGGGYISHMRDEGAGLIGAIDELVRISDRAGLPAEIYHLKASGQPNWPLMDEALERIETARCRGAPIGANVYPYTASSTGLTSIIPPEFHEGGATALYDRLADPAARDAIRQAILQAGRWGDADAAKDIAILGVQQPQNRAFQTMTLQAVAEHRGVHPVDAALDLIRDDRSRVSVAFFSMSEDNLVQQLRRPWVSVGSDAASMAPEGVFLESPTHPRAYGTFARMLGKYVRDDAVLTLSEAIDRITWLPAARFGLQSRGQIAADYFADLVVFDPETITDRATFAHPHQLASGVADVIVNGTHAVRAGTSTGSLAGRAVYGPGRRR